MAYSLLLLIALIRLHALCSLVSAVVMFTGYVYSERLP